MANESAPGAWDSKLALQLFQSGGVEESFAVNARVFVETEKSTGFFAKGEKIYLLREGQIALTQKGKPIHLVLPGEMFGEGALITGAPRSATATALKPAKVLSLDEKGFHAALGKNPEFALMMVATLSEQLRRTIERVTAKRPGPLPPQQGAGVSEAKLKQFRKAMGNPALRTAMAGEPLLMKGSMGLFMFVVIDGQISLSIDGREVERVGPGGIFGESALLSGGSRAATAVAESGVAWLPVTRDEFLEVVRVDPVSGIMLLSSMSERLRHVSSLLAEA